MAKISGGNKLSQALTAMVSKVMANGGGGFVRVGFLQGASYPMKAGKTLTAKRLASVLKSRKGNIAAGASGGKPVAMIAAIQEFGAPSRGIPPRMFFRNMIMVKKHEWPAGIAAQLKATHYDVDLTLRRTGEAIAGQLRQSVIDTNAPPLAASTIARKGFSKPLIDTGHMINSIDYEVKA